MAHHLCESGGTADALGSGSSARTGVRVQVPPLAPLFLRGFEVFTTQVIKQKM